MSVDSVFMRDVRSSAIAILQGEPGREDGGPIVVVVPPSVGALLLLSIIRS